MLCFLFTSGESLFNNQLGIIRFDCLNKYLILISFIIFFFSFLSIIKTLQLERKLIFFSLFLFSYFLFSTYNLLLFFLILEGILFPIIYFFYFYRDYITRNASLSYIFVITLIFRSPFFLFILVNLKKRLNTYIKFEGYINSFYFFLLIIGFLIKLPVYGFHFWLPKAHVDAPVGRSIILARIILKYGRYRLIRCCFYLKSYILNYYFLLLIFFLRTARYFFLSFICIQILDLKVLIAFSSVSHISFAILGNINNFYIRLKRALFMYIRHRIISPLLFFLAFIFYLICNTRLLNRIYSIRQNTILKLILAFGLLINLRFPPFLNFISEIYVFSSIFNYFYIMFIFLFFRFFFNRLYHIKLITIIINKNNNLFNFKFNNFFFKNIYISICLIIFFLLLSITLFII